MSGRAVLLSPGGWDDAERAKRQRLQLAYCLKVGLVVTALTGSLVDACQMVADGLCDAVVLATPRDLDALGLHIAATMCDRPMVIPRQDVSQIETPLTRRRALPLHGPFSD